MNDRIALVTGASRGIGLAIAKKLVSLGYRVLGIYKNNKLVDEIYEDIELYQLDLNDIEACEMFFNELNRKKLLPDVLINNAGITHDSMFHKMTSAKWSEVISTNLVALFNITQPSYINMRQKKFGRIINLSSINANKGQIGQTNYCASKAGVQGFTKSLALEGARFGVTVNSISPGYTATDMVNTIREDIQKSILDLIPVGRFAHAHEIAALVAFLVSDEASYITGANYEINGGLYLG